VDKKEVRLWASDPVFVCAAAAGLLAIVGFRCSNVLWQNPIISILFVFGKSKTVEWKFGSTDATVKEG